MVKTFIPKDGKPVGPAQITSIVVDEHSKRRYRGTVLDDWPLLRSHLGVSDAEWYACPEGWIDVSPAEESE
jgi:hypothetical protein